MKRPVLLVTMIFVGLVIVYVTHALLSLQNILPQMSMSIAEAKSSGTLEVICSAKPNVLFVADKRIQIEEVWIENEYVRDQLLYIIPWRRKTEMRFLCITFANPSVVESLLGEFDSSIEFRAEEIRQLASTKSYNSRDVFWFSLAPNETPWRTLSFVDKRTQKTIGSFQVEKYSGQ